MFGLFDSPEEKNAKMIEKAIKDYKTDYAKSQRETRERNERKR